MKGMIFKKAFLLGGIFLLATCMSVQFSWSCDDDDKWDCDHHDKWDCHKHGKPCQPPKIQKVFLEYQTDSIVFEIWGKNFDNGVTPVVTLGGEFGLSVLEYFDDHIVATLPTSEEEFEFGDYRLVVSTCHDSACKDKHCKDHGSNCKCKYCKDHCSKCKDKYCRDKYSKDHEHKCRCKDRYSLTIPGPSGQPGPPEIIEWRIVSNPGAFNPLTGKFEGSVNCPDNYRVTGGGFLCTASLMVIENKPLQDVNGRGIGWRVISAQVREFPDPELQQVYAICAPVK